MLAAKRIFQDLKKHKIGKVAIITCSDGYGAGGGET
jgi:hypothetical protein